MRTAACLGTDTLGLHCPSYDMSGGLVTTKASSATICTLRLVIFTMASVYAVGQFVYPLKTSVNHRYLVDHNNRPFLLVGDSPQALIGARSSGDAAAYFVDRRAHGFNAVWINLLCDDYTFCNANGTTFDGIAPFTSGASPSDYDLSTPNPAYFSKVDVVLSRAAENGIVVFLDPIETGGWIQTLEHNGTAKAFNYGAFLGGRYKNVPNIVWQSGNDFQTWETSNTDNNLVKQVMAGIASVDNAHLQTIELDFRRSYSNQDTALAPLVTVDFAYTYYDTYDYVLKAYNSSPASPVFMGEANYEGENLPGVDGGSLGNLRKQEYWTLTSGATGQLYGEFQTDQTDWTSLSQIDTPGVTQLSYATRLFNSVAWWNLVPDQTHQVVTAGYGTYRADALDISNSTYATTAWVPDGSVSITFAPVSTTLTLSMSKFKGAVTARWMDPTNGVFTTVNGSPFPNTGSRAFATPGNNSGGDADWLLVLTTQTTGRNRVVVF